MARKSGYNLNVKLTPTLVLEFFVDIWICIDK